MEDVTLTTIADLAGNVALAITLLWLVIDERKKHLDTRERYRDDVHRLNAEHRADLLKLTEELNDVLKEVAGIKSQMWNVQQYQQQRGDTRPLPKIDGHSGD